ncbi:putative KAP-like P-loop ATPase [Ereboglobus sp. PH5-10]|uniref:KAP family P-loop NTPase fold protein n=1 Tax=Ereboglobus sp. PH5-10 TaxID=2940629 RepID=UPI00240584C2|nr:P-loop NTPase fold protein [Ereboglobus sp. PH5-10]MDF9827031.1 putative KAP-like P-loop ATPase [Ereboglobus sp. PH5-10]
MSSFHASTHTTNGTFHSDRPIESAGQDLLGRETFARAIADRIAAWPGTESLVVSLYGEWGAGKSSVKNMMRESLAQQADKKKIPEIIEFNPWQFSGSNQLCSEFFSVIAEKIESLSIKSKVKSKSAVKKSAERLRKYGNKLSFAGQLLTAVGSAASLFVPPAGIAIAGAGAAANAAGGLARAGHEELASEETLHEIKKLLHEDFCNLPSKILVIIDDIDRLTSDEICLLFRLIKANTDFPNIVFLILAQRKYVENALDEITHSRGSEFLEKIVQAPFNIPEPAPNKVSNITFDRIKAIFSTHAPDTDWADAYWLKIWRKSLRLYFTNLRETYRYLNALLFSADAFKARGAFGVNPFDLVALEAIRMFEPGLYDIMPNYMSALTGHGAYDLMHLYFDKPDKRNEETRDILGKACDEKTRSRAINLLCDIFPPLQGASRNLEWGREKRAVSDMFFNNYFALALSPGQISETDIVDFFSFTGDYTSLIKLLNKWRVDQIIDSALSRIDVDTERLIKTNKPDVTFRALLDCGEEWIKSEQPSADLSDHAITWICEMLRDDSIKNRDTLVHDIMKATKASTLYGRMKLVNTIRIENGERGPSNQLVSADTYAKLEKIATQTISKHIKNKALIGHPAFTDIYWNWWRIEKDKATKWAGGQVRKPEFCIILLGSFMSKTTSVSSNSKKTIQRHYLRSEFMKMMENIAEIARWENSLSKIDATKLTSIQRQDLDAFNLAMQRKREGKPIDFLGDI